MAKFEHFFYQSADGLRLHARDYPHLDASLTLLCMPGLTRNAADFEDIGATFQARYRVVAVDQRGRGDSEWDTQASHYRPASYVQDMFDLIEIAGLEKVVLVGTSLGGLMAMMMNAMQPGRFAGVILNDIGPVVNPDGLERIKAYVGKVAPVTSWADAVAQTRRINRIAFPDLSDKGWEKFAHRLYAEDENGVPRLRYDPAIAAPIGDDNDNAVPPDLWSAFDLFADIPLMVIRGELSDILAPECVTEMQRRKPDIKVFEVAGVGHAPILDEHGVVDAISTFLQAIGS